MDEIFESYELGKVLAFTGVEAGSYNTTYKVRTEKRNVILRILEGERYPEEGEQELEHLRRLERNDLPCLRVIPTKTGAGHMLYRGRFVNLFEFIEGPKVSEGDYISAGLLADLGEILARMHLLSRGRRLSRKSRVVELDYIFGAVEDRIDELEKSLGADFTPVMDKIRACLEFDFMSLPGGIVHNDVFPDNTFYAEDEGAVACLIDFSECGTGAFIFDIAAVLNFWIFSKVDAYDRELVDAFLDAYERTRPLSVDERAALPRALDRAALIFLLARFKIFHLEAEADTRRENKDFRELIPMVLASKSIFTSP